MAETITIALHDNPDIKELLELMKSPGYQAQRKEYTALLDGVEAIVKQYNNILTELDSLKEKVSKITDRKNPLVVMVEHLETLATGIGEKLKSLRDGIISFTKNALDTVKEKGLSALGSVFKALHVKDGLQAMSNGLAKSVAGLNNAVARVDRLQQYNQEKATSHEGDNEEAQSQNTEQAASLSGQLADMRFDFENLAPEELKANYERLLALGMDNDLTANENACLQYLIGQVEALLPDRSENESAQEAEAEQDQGEEI